MGPGRINPEGLSLSGPSVRPFSLAPSGLRAVPKAKSIQWIDFRGEGHESYARMAASKAGSVSDLAALG